MVAAPGLNAATDKVWYAKGRQPQFHDDRAIDQLMAMVTALTAEIAILRDRLDTHERLANQDVAVTLSNVESFVPDSTIINARSVQHRRLLRKVFRVLREDLARQESSVGEALADRSTKDFQGV